MQTLRPSEANSATAVLKALSSSVQWYSRHSTHESGGRKIRICPYRPRVCCGQVWRTYCDHNSDSIHGKIPPLGNIGSDASSSGCSYSGTNDDDAAKHSTSGNHTCLYQATMWSDKQSFRHAISGLSSNQQHCQREFQI
jgi:hypothetical protein